MGTNKKALSKEDRRLIAVVSKNVRTLMGVMDWSEHDLARESGVSQKAINNLLNQATGCTITTADKLAKPFGLRGWQLLLDEAPTDPAMASTLTNIVVKVVSTNKEGRDFISAAASRV